MAQQSSRTARDARMQCSRCQVENKDGRRFCASCGAALVVVCAACQFANEPGATFCGGCGAPPRGRLPDRARGRLRLPPGLHAGAPRRAHPGQAEASLEGERKQVTVLFADLKGSMELLAERDPEEARAILDPVIEHMMGAVHRYQGTVNQVMGDGIMALFGAPVAHEDHAVRAGYAALRMQETIGALSPRAGAAAGRAHPDPDRPQLGRGGRARHRQRPPHGLWRGGADDPARRPHGAARRAQAPSSSPRRSPPAEALSHFKPLGASPSRGCPSRWTCSSSSAAEPAALALSGRGVPRAHALRGPRRRAQAAPRGARARGAREGQVIGGHRRAGRREVAPLAELTRSARAARLAHAGERRDLVRPEGAAWMPVARSAARLLPDRRSRRSRRHPSRRSAARLTALDRPWPTWCPPCSALLDVRPSDEPGWAALDPEQRRQAHRWRRSAHHRLGSRERPLALIVENLQWVDAETQAFLDGLVDSLRGDADPPPRQLPARVPARLERADLLQAGSRWSRWRPESAEGCSARSLGEAPGLAALKALARRADGGQSVLPRGERADARRDQGRRRRARRLPAGRAPADASACRPPCRRCSPRASIAWTPEDKGCSSRRR